MNNLADEIRELIWYQLGDGLNATDVNEAVEVFEALVQREIRTARIDELNKTCENWEDNPTLPATYMIDRLKSLSGEQEGAE